MKMEVSNNDRFSEDLFVKNVCHECTATNVDRKCAGCEMSLDNFDMIFQDGEQKVVGSNEFFK